MDRGTIEATTKIGDRVKVEASMSTMEMDYEIKVNIVGRFCGFIHDVDVLVIGNESKLQVHPTLITFWKNTES